MASTNEIAVASPKKAKAVHVANVTRYDGPGVQVPKDMSIKTAIETLNRQLQADETTKAVAADFPAFPYEGAWATSVALRELFGFAVEDNVKDMFGRNSNTTLNVTINAAGDTERVPWGRFVVPGIDGYLQTSATRDGVFWKFVLGGEIKGKHEHKFVALVDKIKEILATRSLYRGTAFRVSFTDENGEWRPYPEATFLDVGDAPRPIFQAGLEDQFDHDLLAYVTHSHLVKQLNGGTVKRGALLAGPYGVGKTLSARYVARRATENGWTYIYLDKPEHFGLAYSLAQAYQPCVLFTEDIDQVIGLDRNHDVNTMLNVLDGVENKMSDVLCIFTSNHGEKINPAMFRPGRIDVTLAVPPPDAEAAIRLARFYAEGMIEGSDADFEEAGRLLDGKIPATIREAVNRARIRATVRAGTANAPIINADLVRAAQAIEGERGLFSPADENMIRKTGLEIGRFAMSKMGGHLYEAMVQG